MAIPISPEIQPEKKIHLPKDDAITPSLTPEQAERRATKTHFALGEDSPGMDILRSDLTDQTEERLRKNAAAMESLRVQKIKQGLIQDVVNEAAKQGRELSAEEEESILTLGKKDIVDSKLILEGLFAKRFVESMALADTSDGEETPYQEASMENPDEADAILDVGQHIALKQEAFHRILQETQSEVDNSGWGSYLWDFGETLLPGRSIYGPMRNAVKDIPNQSIFTGSALESMVEYIWALPADQAADVARQTIQGLDNVLDKAIFAKALVEYSGSDKLWDNTYSAIDIADITGIAGKVISRPLKASRLLTSVKEGVKANARADMTVSDALAAAGNVEASAQVKAGEFLKGMVDTAATPGRTQRQVADLQKIMPGVFNPKSYLGNAGTLSSENARRFLQTMGESQDALMGIFFRTINNPRVTTAEAIKAMYRAADEKARTIYSEIEDHIFDTVAERGSEEAFGGTDHLSVYFGTKKATPFKTEAAAKNMANNYLGFNEGQYEIVQRNGGWAVRITQPVDETAQEVRINRIGTTNKTPVSLRNRIFSWIRNPEYTLAEDHNKFREVMTYGRSEAIRYMHEAVKPLASKLSKNQKDRLRDMIDSNRTMTEKVLVPDGALGKVEEFQGSWYYTVSDYEAAYQQRFKSAPSMEEIEAYFTYKMVHDWDWYGRNIGLYRDKTRQGFQQFKISFPQKVAGDLRDEPIPMETKWFEGRLVDNIPEWGKDFTIAWAPEKGGKKFRFDFSQGKTFGKREREQIEKMIASGKVKVVQVWNPKDKYVRDLVGAKGEVVNYILTPSVKSKPLDALQVPYRGGPHSVYNAELHYVKQASSHIAQTGRRILDADRTWIAANIRGEAEKFAKSINTAREMIRDGASDAALTRFARENLPVHTAKAVRALFRKKGDKTTEGLFDLDTPFVVTQSGERVNVDGYWPDQKLVDVLTDENSPLGSTATQFTQHRDDLLWGIKETGSSQNPVYKYHQMERANPFETLARSAGVLLNNRYFDDYKHFAIENWITEFGDLLNIKKSDILADPLRALQDATFKTDKSLAVQIAAAKSARRNILYLLGQDSREATMFQAARDRILDEAYKRWGKDSAERVLKPVRWMANSDPVQMARGWVFSAKMGFWNPRQLFMQAQGSVIVAGIDGNPVRAIQANLASPLMRALMNGKGNAKFRAHIAKSAEGLGIKRDEFLEMFDAAERSGILNVGGEVAQLDRLDNGVFATKAQRVQNVSNVLFTEGERHVRSVAFSTAFLKWRRANPGVKLTDKELRGIISRAHLLTGDMTRAANNPALQSGVQSLFTQFFTFHTRMTELMIGGRLTNAEKLRLTLLMSTMYGIPAGALGLAFGGFGVNTYDEVREIALENGWNVDDPKVRLFFDGVGGYVSSAIADERVNFGKSFGPSGLSYLTDLLDGDVSVLFGAGGRFIRDQLATLEPLTYWAMSAWDNNPDTQFKLTAEDLFTAFREISAVNNAARGWYAWNTGHLLTKGDLVIDDMDKRMSVVSAITGLTPQSADDVWLKKDAIKSQREAKLTATTEASTYGRRWATAMKDGNDVDAKIFWNNMLSVLRVGGLDELEIANFVGRLFKENKPLLEQVSEDFVRSMRSPEVRDEEARQMRQRFQEKQ